MIAFAVTIWLIVGCLVLAIQWESGSKEHFLEGMEEARQQHHMSPFWIYSIAGFTLILAVVAWPRFLGRREQ